MFGHITVDILYLIYLNILAYSPLILYIIW